MDSYAKDAYSRRLKRVAHRSIAYAVKEFSPTMLSGEVVSVNTLEIESISTSGLVYWGEGYDRRCIEMRHVVPEDGRWPVVLRPEDIALVLEGTRGKVFVAVGPEVDDIIEY